MAVLRDFSDLYQTLACRSAQSSPARPNSYVLNPPRVRRNERKFLSTETRGSQQFRTYSSKDGMLGVLHEDQTKDFSRYTRLPAIGNLPSDKSKKPNFTRQKTYTVFDPVYVKGPAGDGEISTKITYSESHLNSQLSSWKKKKKLLPNRRKVEEDIAKELEERKERMQEKFSKSIHGNRLQVSEELITATRELRVGEPVGGKGAFWIDF